MDQSIELPTKILVLDSDAQSRRSTVEILRVGADQSGRYELYEAEKGESCIRLARQIKPDLILLDILLPDISGLELCRRIKADPGLLGVFIILYSTHKHTLEESTNALETGADSYIVAPASNQELLAQVRAMLRLKRAEDTLRKQSHNLGERVKELKCLYGLSTLVEKADASLHEVLQGVLALIPPA